MAWFQSLMEWSGWIRGVLGSSARVFEKINGGGVIFSELSPRPHDTGMVTMISQNLNEFELHLRAILGLPIPTIEQLGPAASAVILADRNSDKISFEGVAEALAEPQTDLRLFGKPDSRPYRRMGVALAKGKDTDEARKKAFDAAQKVKIQYGE